MIAQIEAKEVIAFRQKTLADDDVIGRVAAPFPAVKGDYKAATWAWRHTRVIVTGEGHRVVVACLIASSIKDDDLLSGQSRADTSHWIAGGNGLYSPAAN